MAAAALEALRAASSDSQRDRVVAALVIVPHDTEVRGALLSDARVLHAGHPYPDESSEHAAAAAEALLHDADAGDVVFVLLSGGASALCAAPAASLSVGEYADVVRMLMQTGADIRALNTVRTHIDRLKGGRMARLAAPSRVLGLIVSDVVGSPLDVIASGPLTPCTSTPGDALGILTAAGLLPRVPAGVRNALESGRYAADQNSDDVSSDASAAGEFDHVRTEIVLDNRSAIEGAAAEARRLGYDTRCVSEPVTGSARDAGTRIAREAVACADELRPGDRPVCVVYGGETTVQVKGSGRGGRNQELVLAAAITIAGDPRITVASVGTDGIDGSSDAAGAVADGHTVANGSRADTSAVGALENNDSFTFFAQEGGLVRTGPTGTNVMDVQIALIDPI